MRRQRNSPVRNAGTCEFGELCARRRLSLLSLLPYGCILASHKIAVTPSFLQALLSIAQN